MKIKTTITDARTVREAEELEKKMDGKRIEESTVDACRIFLARGVASPRRGKGR